MKKLGITDTGNVANYIDWFKGDDVVVETLEVGSNSYKDCSGILLSGGIDIDPDEYDGEKEYENSPAEGWNRSRDVYEQELYKYAKANKIPILAICRGLQLVNVAEGGTLIQDLDGKNAVHKKEETDKEHNVTIDSRTFLGDVTGSMSGIVNSAHHQAVDPESIGRALMVNAVSKDDVIEGLEFKDKTNKGFMLAVQWHPERMQNKENSPLSQSIKKAFLSAIRSFSK
ncbi:MAG TPA: gamma-glutamyl-gamma-aminobutyrate hydrolase family protein [Cyclobacteriaceae bacterium]|nr:gamma-glutamyl-gamma-aminobutyrate hydrolase family protein [Cyclobacteriaceae bacterium]